MSLTAMATMQRRAKMLLYAALTCTLLSTAFVNGFVLPPAFTKTRQQAQSLSSCLYMTSDDSSSSSSWMESLRARQLEIETKRHELDQKWRNADCASGPRIGLPDWVRRLDVSDYPLVACGSASGAIFVSNLETQEVLAQGVSEEEDDEDIINNVEVLHVMFGEYDGGGTFAIAMKRNLICSAGRQGGVQIWRYDASSTELISQGSIQALEGVFVTSLQLDDDDLLWVGDADGNLKAFFYNSPDLPLALQKEPHLSWNFGSIITYLESNQEAGCGVCTTEDRRVIVFSLEDDDDVLGTWWPPFRDKTMYGQCASIIPRKDGGYAIACGGSDGILFTKSLNWAEENGGVDEDDPFLDDETVCRPSHLGPIGSIACPSPDVLVTGGRDGTMRVWDFSDCKNPSCLYQLIGYKVWLGSLWTDGIRLVSDGCDNAIVMHDFSKEPGSAE